MVGHSKKLAGCRPCLPLAMPLIRVVTDAYFHTYFADQNNFKKAGTFWLYPVNKLHENNIICI